MPPIDLFSTTNIPQFLSKLWKMVNDPDTDDLIRWGPVEPTGRRLIIREDVKLHLLPTYYKHNNMSSFIRQLNMYGFHRVSTEVDEVQFFHKWFQKEQPNLIKKIKRKNPPLKIADTTTEENVDQIGKVLADVQVLQGHQENVYNQLDELRQENATLWRELAVFRKRFSKQQKIINKLINFFETIVHPSQRGLGTLGVKRRYPLMIDNSKKKTNTDLISNDPRIYKPNPGIGLNNCTGSYAAKNSKNDITIDDPLALPAIKTEPDDTDSLNMECSEMITPDSLVDINRAGFYLKDANLIQKTIPDNFLADPLNIEILPKPDSDLEAIQIITRDKQVEASRVKFPLETSNLTQDISQVAKQVYDNTFLKKTETVDPLLLDVNLPHIINSNMKVTNTTKDNPLIFEILFQSETHQNDFKMITDDMQQKSKEKSLNKFLRSKPSNLDVNADCATTMSVYATHCSSQSIRSPQVGQSRLRQALEFDGKASAPGSSYEEQL